MPLKLACKLVGTRQPGQPIIVMLHGFLGCSNDWLPLLNPYLSQQAFLLIDLPGHGQTQVFPQNHNSCWFRLFDQALNKALRDFKVDYYRLYGYSLGGRLALYHAQQQPAGLTSLMLESCHPGLKSTRQKLARQAWLSRWHQRILSQPCHQWLSSWYQQAVFASLTPQQRHQQIYQRLVRPRARHWAQALLGWSVTKQPNLFHLMRQPSVPTRLLVGANDPNYVKLARQMRRKHWPLTIKICRKGGHNLRATSAWEWRQAFGQWLNSGISND